MKIAKLTPAGSSAHARLAAAALAALTLAATGPAFAASGTWTNGAADNNWQTNANWDATPFPGFTTNVFTSTDNAGFATAGTGTINLGDLINVQSIFFGAAPLGVAGTNNANAFTIGDANDTLNLSGGTTNTAGGVFIGSGVTGASENIGVSGTTVNVSGTNCNFNNASTTSGVNLTVAGNIGHTVAGNTNLFLGSTGALAAGGNVNVTGNVSSATGTLAIFKNGLNAATLSGTVTTNNAAITVRGGTLNLNGATNTGTAGITVGDNSGSGGSAVLNINADLTTLNLALGLTNTGRTGAVYQTAGTATLTQAAGAANFQIGAAPTPGQAFSGYYKMSGGSVTANEIDVGGNFSNSVGVMEVTGGVATTNGYLTVGRGVSTSSGTVNVTGGTLNTGASATLTGPIALDWGTLAGAQAVLNVGGGTGPAAVTGGNSTTATGQFVGRGLNLAESATAGTLGIANLLTNGTLTVSDVVASQGAAATSHLNFNGGTLKATATNLGANFITSANIKAVNVYGTGGTIDNSSTNITISHAIVAPVGQGVTAATVAVPGGGSGYIGVPLVKLTGGTGSGATGYATISGGAVTGIVITSPGIGYTAGDTLTATFYGGVGNGGTIATTVTGIPVAANSQAGGLTFTGSGTTTLSGANTYAGPTVVNGGVLQAGVASVAGTSGAFGNNSAVTLANTAGVGLDVNGFAVQVGSLAGGGANGGNVTLGSGTLTVANATPASYAGVISGTGGLTAAGTAAQVLTGVNTYTGATTINSGATLQLGDGTNGNDGTIAATSGVTDNGTLAFNRFGTTNTAGYVISGAGGVSKTGVGTQSLTGANTYTGATTITAGTLRVANATAISNVLSATGGGVTLGTAGGRLLLDYTGGTSPAATVAGLLAPRYNATSPGSSANFTTGTVRSSAALPGGRTIGYGDTGTGAASTIPGYAVNTVVVRVTLEGDTDLDGDVDFNDFLTLQNFYNQTGTRFDQGNFNYDNVTDFNDFLALQNNYGQSIGFDGAAPKAVLVTAEQIAALDAFAAANAPVPEPMGLAGLALGGMILGRRRSRS